MTVLRSGRLGQIAKSLKIRVINSTRPHAITILTSAVTICNNIQLRLKVEPLFETFLG